MITFDFGKYFKNIDNYALLITDNKLNGNRLKLSVIKGFMNREHIFISKRLVLKCITKPTLKEKIQSFNRLVFKWIYDECNSVNNISFR